LLREFALSNLQTVAVQITILGSGSSGNCTYVETDQSRLLIDAGLSGRQIRNRLLSIGRTVESLTGILITHEHLDHVQGLAALAAKVNVPVYCNRLTRESIDLQLEIKPTFHLFATGGSFETGDVVVDTFNVPHDAYDPVGFLLRTPGGNIGFLTDLGHATKLVVQRVRASNVLVIEANHDMKMLQDDTRRPWSIKQRILSRHGHLSNDAAATALQDIVTQDLQQVYLCHLSSDCNRPELAQYVAKEALEKVGATQVGITVSTQEVPTAPYSFNVAPRPAASPLPFDPNTSAEPLFEQPDLWFGGARLSPPARPNL